MSKYDWTQVFQTLLFLNLIKCMHHAHFQTNQRRHLKIYIGGLLMPVAQWSEILYNCNNLWDCLGAIISIWDSSIVPKHCRKSHLSSTPLTMSMAWGPVGILIYFCDSTCTINLHTSWTMMHEMPTPNRWEMVLYSMFVPSLHNAMAILFSTDIYRYAHYCRTLQVGTEWSAQIVKCCSIDLKIFFHSGSSEDAVISMKAWLLFVTQSDRRCSVLPMIQFATIADTISRKSSSSHS